jgi:hypothetical protein
MRRSHLPLRAPAMSFSGGHTLFPEGGTRPIRGNGSLPLVLDAWARVSTRMTHLAKDRGDPYWLHMAVVVPVSPRLVPSLSIRTGRRLPRAVG